MDDDAARALSRACSGSAEDKDVVDDDATRGKWQFADGSEGKEVVDERSEESVIKPDDDATRGKRQFADGSEGKDVVDERSEEHDIAAHPGFEVGPLRDPSARFRSGPSPRGGLVLAVSGVFLSVVFTLLFGARVGAFCIALTLAIAGTWRAVKPRARFAAGIVVRSKNVDVFVYFTLAGLIALLAATVPGLS